MTNRSLLLSALLVLPVLALAQENPFDGEVPVEADISMELEDMAEKLERGKHLAASGNGSSTPCAVCHNMDGAGRPAAGIPRLAQQDESYLLKQLNDYKSGKRDDFAMKEVVESLSASEMEDISTYYALQAGTGPQPNTPPTKLMALGFWISQYGIIEKDVPACNSCHGEAGQGNPPVFPRLAGQSAAYAKNELKALQVGDRSNDPGDMMGRIAKRLSGEEIRAIAAYYETLQ